MVRYILSLCVVKADIFVDAEENLGNACRSDLVNHGAQKIDAWFLLYHRHK